MQERLPDATVSNSYGMTEAGPAYIVMPKEEVTKRIGSVGKPVGPMELKIVREDDSPCDPREVGELLSRMPGRQREYYKDEAATASTWTEDGWLRSGDLGYLDEDGFLYLVGARRTSSSGVATTSTPPTSRPCCSSTPTCRRRR